MGRDVCIIAGNGVSFGVWHINGNAWGFSIVVGQVRGRRACAEPTRRVDDHWSSYIHRC
jgi:hypothetical protein